MNLSSRGTRTPTSAAVPPWPPLATPRLQLLPLTLALVEAVLGDRRDEAEALVGACMPARWPHREFVERAFSTPLEDIRKNPEASLWGGRVMKVVRAEGQEYVIGSVVFHGRPGDDGIAEVAYGVDEASQGQGFATEAVHACVSWALTQDGVRAVQAATFAWHRASLRVIEKVGMVPVGVRAHETLGDLLVFEVRRG